MTVAKKQFDRNIAACAGRVDRPTGQHTNKQTSKPTTEQRAHFVLSAQKSHLSWCAAKELGNRTLRSQIRKRALLHGPPALRRRRLLPKPPERGTITAAPLAEGRPP